MAHKELHREFKASKVQMEDNIFENITSIRIPPEIWAKIFEFAKPQQPKHLLKLRLVCKTWRDVIDENFEMKIKINDDTMNVTDFRRFKRVTHCIVSTFVRQVEPNINRNYIQLFSDPALVTKLTICGFISRQNFWLFTEQCHNITEFILTGVMLTKEARMFESAKIQNFLQGIKKLVITNACITACKVGEENLIALLSSAMPNLTTIKIRLYSELFEDHILSLVRQCRALETLELTLLSLHAPQPILNPFPVVSIPTLTTLKIELSRDSCFQVWLPFLRAQSTLKVLRIFVNSFELDGQVQETILQNELSLEYLELGLINHIYCSLITQNLFQRLVKLKNLKLYGKNQPILDNINLLSLSLETLELNNFWCSQLELDAIEKRVASLITRNISYFRV